jgi:hypothetical protein
VENQVQEILIWPVANDYGPDRVVVEGGKVVCELRIGLQVGVCLPQ